MDIPSIATDEYSVLGDVLYHCLSGIHTYTGAVANVPLFLVNKAVTIESCW